jgi:hypothetical protein
MTRLLDKLKSWWASRRPKDLSKCLLVEWDDNVVRVKMMDSLSKDWNQEFFWGAVTRVCFSDGGISMSDMVFLDVQGREKPAVVPTKARGGPEFMAELLRRGLLPQDIFKKAVTSSPGGTYCWPPDEGKRDLRNT